jgi:hypothetical protein
MNDVLTWDPAAEEELNEEDQQLKNELELLVERLTVSLSAGKPFVQRSKRHTGAKHGALQARP